jgi:hypothetical protein
MEGSVVFGVVGEARGEPMIGYLEEPVSVTPEVMNLAAPVAATEVFRFAAPCAGHGCRHFDGADCRLAGRVVQLLPLTVDLPPACAIRPECRWWQQEGKEACRRCPQIVSEVVGPSDLLRRLAGPDQREPAIRSEPA